MADKTKLKLLYKLESLVLNNGNPDEILQLRQKLGMLVGTRNSYKGFCPEQYKKMRASGMTDVHIRTEFNMSQSGLYKQKIRYGLVEKR